MNFEINGKVALVTGGASGIGLTIVKDLLANGAKGVSLADVNVDLGQKTIEALGEEFGKGRAIFVKTDVTVREEIEVAFKKTVETFKYVDILVNSAGVYNEPLWENEIKINVTGVISGMILGIENYLQKYRQGQEAVIVNISSVAGVYPFPVEPVYTATKFAVTAATLTWGLPVHYEKTKVRVLAICPRFTRTPLVVKHKNIHLGDRYDEIFRQVFSGDMDWQTPEDVSRETIKVIRKAESGTAWVVEGGNPAYQFTWPNYTTMKNNTL